MENGNRSSGVNVFAFDIETIPDTAGGSRIYGLSGLEAVDVAKAMLQMRQQESGGSDFLPLYLHRVVAISAVLRSADRVTVWSLGNEEAAEDELVRRFFDGIERFRPLLVSWNGRGFDLPVLHYRALLHGIEAAHYWDVGEEDRESRWNNYISRFHWRHIDLMDVLSGYQPRATAPLDAIATLVGLPGKMGMSGSQVWDAYQKGDIRGIRHYCETDALNTYLLYLRFERMRGRLSVTAYEKECGLLRETLTAEGRPHLRAFAQAWQAC